MYQSSRRSRLSGPQQGAAARDQAHAIAMKRKEEYLGARVPRELKNKVIERADRLGIPVSILIRNVLEEAFREDGTLPLGQSKPSVDMRAEALNLGGAPKFPGVLGWEDIRLNRLVNCAACGAKLQAGSRVTLGVGAPGEEHIILCDLCKESV